MLQGWAWYSTNSQVNSTVLAPYLMSWGISTRCTFLIPTFKSSTSRMEWSISTKYKRQVAKSHGNGFTSSFAKTSMVLSSKTKVSESLKCTYFSKNMCSNRTLAQKQHMNTRIRNRLYSAMMSTSRSLGSNQKRQTTTFLILTSRGPKILRILKVSVTRKIMWCKIGKMASWSLPLCALAWRKYQLNTFQQWGLSLCKN